MITGFEKLVEERILAAQRKGEFDNLEGAGKPLKKEDMSRVPQELRLAYKILKNADCLPPEVELKNEIVRTENLLADLEDEQERYQTIQKLNFLIMKLNTLRNTSVSTEIPQQYEQALLDRMAASRKAKKSSR
ncbi:MAG: DnaJ family domain-containing protein [Thermodesulfobacteriota bacterium]